MTQVPELSSLPFLGNVADVDPSATHVSYSRLADIHGEVFGFYMASQHTIVVNSYDVWNDCCDEKVLEKIPAGAAIEARHMLGDGLFTAFNGEENWAIAHRILMPKFGPVSNGPNITSSSRVLHKFAGHVPKQTRLHSRNFHG